MSTTIPRNRRVLLVDDEDVIPVSLIDCNKKAGALLEFEYAQDVGEAVTKLNEKCFDCAVIDVRLPGVTGVSLGALVREHDVNIPLAYLTNLDTEAVRKEAVAQRAFFLYKLRFMDSRESIKELLTIIQQMAELNPCLEAGRRVDNYGFARKLNQTPIEIPEVLATLLSHSKAIAA